ncbi:MULTISPECIES: hypothetical protein [unclassified Micromonospora]|uniref:Rv0361 family membrane protein n=1 Tax=unclassified Micromonospora TaxID=2617518 RepID=UPI00332B1810
MIIVDKNKRNGLIAGAGALLLLLCCSSGVFGYRAVFKDDAEDVAEKYFSAIQDRSIDDLRAVICASEQKNFDGDEWDDDEGLLDWEITSSKERENSATVTADFTGTDGGEIRTGNITMTLVKEDGDWKVCDVDEDRD